VFCINHSVYLQCSESLQPVARAYGLSAHVRSKKWDTSQGYHNINLWVCDLFFVKMVKASSQKMWRVKNGPVMIFFYNATGHLFLITFSTFVVCQKLPDWETSLPFSLAKKQGRSAVSLQPVMALTCEACLRLTGSKAARTPPHLVSDCAGV